MLQHNKLRYVISFFAISVMATISSVVMSSPALAVGYSHSYLQPMVVEIHADGGVYNLPVKGFLGGVSWGDGATTSCIPLPGQPPCDGMTHSYVAPGNYTIRIGVDNGSDTFTGFGNDCTGQPNGGRITSVTSWGDYVNSPSFTSLSGAFNGETLLTTLPATFPAHVTDVTCMLKGATLYNSPNTSAWYTAAVTQMGGLFDGASSFNQPLTTWMTSNVTNMAMMFRGATSFNQDLTSWNVSNVAGMSEMFRGATSFNQPLNTWNTSSVYYMNEMFMDASIFNQNINSWNVSGVHFFQDMFNSALAFNEPLNSWNTSAAESMSGMFMNAGSFNQTVNSWNVHNVRDVVDMFAFAISYNQPMDLWNTSNIENFGGMFSGASSFNQNLNNWDMSHANNLGWMFASATAFNQPLNTWDTSQVLSFEGMFANTGTFNQPLNTWNTGQAINLAWMFNQAVSFNQPLNTWDTSHVQFLDNMFNSATSFNQSLAGWNVTSVIEAPDMFALAPLSATNYSAILSSWGAQNVVHNVTLGMVGAKYYSSAVSGRDALITAGWIVNDQGLEATPPPSPDPGASNSTLASTGDYARGPLFTGGTVLLLLGISLVVWRRRRTY